MSGREAALRSMIGRALDEYNQAQDDLRFAMDQVYRGAAKRIPAKLWAARDAARAKYQGLVALQPKQQPKD